MISSHPYVAKKSKTEILSFPVDMETCTRGQLKLVLCATSSKLTLTVLGLRSLPQSCVSRDLPTYVYLKVSLYPDHDNKIRHKTDVMPVENDAVTLHDSFSFNIGRRECNKRLLISAWSRQKQRCHDSANFIGCMSFGIRKIVAKQEVMQGWYYFLSESLGRKKHLTSKHISEDTYSSQSLRSSTLHVRTLNIYPQDVAPNNTNSRSLGRDRLYQENTSQHQANLNDQIYKTFSKKRVLGDFPVAPKRRRLYQDENLNRFTGDLHKTDNQHFTVGVAVGKRSCDVTKSRAPLKSGGRTPTGRRHVRRKSYSSTDLRVLQEAYRKNTTESNSAQKSQDSHHTADEELRSATLRVQRTHSAKIVKQPEMESSQEFVTASVVTKCTANVARRRKLCDVPASKRSVSCYGNPSLDQYPEHVIEQVTRGLSNSVKPQSKDPSRSPDYRDVGYHSETTSMSSVTSSDSDSGSSEEECRPVTKMADVRPVGFAKKLSTKSVTRNSSKTSVVESEVRKIGTMQSLKTWFNRNPDKVSDDCPRRKISTPTKSLSTGWLFRYKSAADQAISRQLKRSISLRNDTKKTCENCDVSARPLYEVLKSKGGVESFKAFLKGEYSDENLDFWLECESYKNVKTNRRQKMATKIFERFVKSGSPDEINIDDETRKMTQEGVSLPNATTFERAQQKIFDLMSRDSFRRFQMSELQKCKCNQ
uniref:Uncharacterized protein LOC100182918 n=1 Tax=Phallusia mammillata TaxID=59560 RepID=A0A6F9DIH8_9ASCI|nr:uncharacterized protein LOC100182918 [Phallusia mammillata]